MFYNHLKIAVRTLWRHKTFSGINLLGLTLGTICCLYMVLYVQHHYGYDQHHENAEQVYRITSELTLGDSKEAMNMATCSPPIPLAMQADFPEVLVATRACQPIGVAQQLLRVNEDVYFEDAGYYVDSTFFEVLQYHFVEGRSTTALVAPFSVVISQTLAKRLFGNESALGESIAIGDWGEAAPFKVTGVIDYSLGDSHLHSHLFMSMNSSDVGQFVRQNTSWSGNNFLYGYVRLAPGTDANALAAKFPAFLQQHGGDQLRESGMKKKLSLQVVTAIHTQTNLAADTAGNTSKTFLSLLLAIAGFIQLVACINFMNLTTARATRRAQEVGVRKVVGANRRSLFGQFLVESLLLSFLAVGLALPLTQLVLPIINQLTGAEIVISLSGETLLLLLGIALGTGLLAGGYPALYLSAFKPMALFKPENHQGSASWLRQGLVVGQMVVASVLIISALIIHTQVDYLLNKDLGFEATQKVVFDLQGSSDGSNVANLANELRRMSQVRNVSAMLQLPGKSLSRDIGLYKLGQSMDESKIVWLDYADEHYLDVLKIDLLEGRVLTLADTVVEESNFRVMVNEAVLDALQIPITEAVGTVLRSDFEDNRMGMTIVGVMENVMYQKLTEELRPFMIIAEAPENLPFLVADVNTEDYGRFLAQAQDSWERVIPDLPFKYSFLEEDIAKLYQTEQVLSRIIGTFTFVAIAIACLGLFGLSVYAAEKRKKEVSIRKVLGASIRNLVALLSKEFLLLVGMAVLIASPIAYFGMQQWLADFAYRTSIHWWIFGLTGLLTMVIAFLTVSLQALRAALMNPSDNLRGE